MNNLIERRLQELLGGEPLDFLRERTRAPSLDFSDQASVPLPPMRPDPDALDFSSQSLDFSEFAIDPEAHGLASQIGSNLKEFVKGPIPGAIQMGGTALKGAAAHDPVLAMARNIEPYKDDIARVPQMDAAELAAFRRKVEQESAPATRNAVQSAISDMLDGGMTPEEVFQQFSGPTPIAEHGLYRAGEGVQQFGRDLLPAAPGYEDSIGRQLGEGLGSLGAGVAASALGGPVAGGAAFTMAGSGEALERAVAAGTTEQEQIKAALYGIAPGATDIVPVEMLLDRIKVPAPFRGPLARAIGKIGGQAFVEGVQEGGQEFLQNLIAREVYDPEQELTEGVLPGAGVGAGVGGIAETIKQIGVATLGGRRGRQGGAGDAAEQPQAPQQAPAGQAALERPAIRLPDQSSRLEMAPDAPTAEPVADIEAQLADLADPENPRQGVYVPRGGAGRLAPGTVAGLTEVPNIDGKDGSLFVTQPELADLAVRARDAGVPLQQIIGALTGAGEGKPVDGTKVVQQKTEDGAVTRERVVTEAEVAPTEQEFAAPGRTVETVEPQEVLQRREEKIADEDVATLREQGWTDEDIADMDASERAAALEEAREQGVTPPPLDFSAQAVDENAGTRDKPVKVEKAEDIGPAAERVETAPTEAQKAANNYRKGHIKVHGLDITIETPKGAERSGVGADGEPWSVTSPAHYGYFKKSEGADGEQVDVYVGDDPASDRVFIVSQVDPDTNEFDEHKVIMGVRTLDEAEDIYREGFSDGRGGARMGSIEEMSVAEFEGWLENPPQPDAEPAEPAAEEHPGLVIKSLETGEETQLQPRGTVPPAPAAPEPQIGKSESDEIAPVTDEPEAAVARADAPAPALRDALAAGDLKDAHTLRRFAKEQGIEATGKQLEELIETELVRAARETVAVSDQPRAVYDRLAQIYENQPNLASRTAASVTNQAYSTPLPLAYLASRLAGVSGARTVYEPTAGNGALLIEADPRKQTVHANEMDTRRAAALRSQGFKVTENDATTAKLPADIDAIVMNPPFGAVREGGASKVFSVDDLSTTAIDHAIALRALKALASQGRAVIILGGVKAESEVDRRKGYRGKAKREFFARLYKSYNVTDHFTVDGKLYSRQGAGWPVDVIVVEGHGKSARPLPAAQPPTIFKSWADLAEKLPDGSSQPDTGRVRQPADGPARTDEPARAGSGNEPGRGDPKRSRPAGLQSKQDKSDGVRDVSDRGEPAAVRGGRDAPPLDSGRAGRDAGRAGERSGARREPVDDKPNAAGQSSYRPQSAQPSLNTLVPANMARAARQALAKVEDRRGEIDAYVAKNLDYEPGELSRYFSAEQIDAIAAAIDQYERGAAFIIGDQTGIGKGRVNAAMIRFALKHDMVPVFATETVDLFGDIYRDLNDIGMTGNRAPRLLMTNTGESVPLDEEAVAWKEEYDRARADRTPSPKRRGTFLTSGNKERQEKAMLELAAGKGEHNVLLTTYSQMQTIKKGETFRRSLLHKLAPRAFVILDEAHNAGGQGSARGWKKSTDAPDRAQFFRQIVGKAKGVMYSSATYAKRPEVMDLFARTDMGKAVQNPKDLPELIAKGGVPMQQIVATMLSESGQYLRRERSFEGVTYEVEGVPVDEGTYDHFSGALRSVFEFDLMVKDLRDKFMQDELDAMGAGKGRDNAVGDAGAHATEFSSVMHNIINQMLLAIRADQVAERAIAAHKRGEKPIIALSNTMESFISDYAENADIGIGDEIDVTFGDVLSRYLARTLRVTIKDADGRKSHKVIPADRLPPQIQSMYRDALDMINGGEYGAMPVSPIDWMRLRLEKAGMGVVEVTGRKTMIDYSQTPPVLKARSAREMGPSGKRVSIAAFNAGKLDALIINKSGSTGVSMHASEKFRDKKPRRMLLAQADANPDTHMQMLGRIHRTGQVELPRYSQIVAEIPAEARPTAVLMKKMASLNANTTGARGSIFMGDAVDFMNEYGDRVVADLMTSEPDWNARMGYPVKSDDHGRLLAEDAARKVTGRLVLLPPKQQAELLDRIQASYVEVLKHLDDAGENTLEAKTFDLQARPVEQVLLQPRKGDGPFLDAVQLEKLSVKSQGRAMLPGEIAERIAGVIGDKAQGAPLPSLQHLEEAGRKWAVAKVERITQVATEWGKGKARDMVGDDARARFERTHAAEISRLKTFAQIAHPGARVTLGMGEEDIHGIVISCDRIGKAQNPVAPGSWLVEVAVPDGKRTIALSTARLFLASEAKGDDEIGATIKKADRGSELASLIPRFELANKEGREDRYMVTGNILSGYDQTAGRGQLVNFTMEDGSSRPGILMKRGFALDKFMAARAIKFSTPEQIAQFIDRVPGSKVTSIDDIVTIQPRDAGHYYIDMPSARSTGGRYYTEAAVQKAVGGGDAFRKYGSTMRAVVDRGQLLKALAAMKALDATFQTKQAQDIASEIINPSRRKASSSEEDGSAPNLKISKADAAELSDRLTVAVNLVTRIAGTKVKVVFHDTIPFEGPAFEHAKEQMGAFAGPGRQLRTTVGGYYERYADGRALIALATRDPAYDPVSTAAHEAWHHIEDLVLTSAERRLLDAEMPRIRRYAAPVLRRSPDDPTMQKLPAEEARAFAFERWRREREDGLPSGGLHIGVRRFFERIRQMLAGVRNVLRGLGYRTFEDVFEQARKGDYALNELRPRSAPGARKASVLPAAVMAETGYMGLRARRLMGRAGNLLDRARVKIQDRALPIRRYQEAVEAETGIKLPLNLDVYVAEALYHGKAGERLIDMQRDSVEPMIEMMRAESIAMDEMGDYLYARHAAERNAAIAEIDPTRTDGSGMSDVEAGQVLSRVRASGKQAAYDRIAGMVDAMIEETRKELLRSGLIDRATFDQWQTQYAHYVPLRGFEAGNDTDVERPRTGRGFDVRGPEAYRALGRRSKADNPIIYAVLQGQQAIVRSEKNRVAKTLLRAVNAHPNPGVWKVYKGEVKRRLNPDSGLVETYYVPPAFVHRDNLFAVKVGGKTSWIEVKHPALARALRGVGTDLQNAVVRSMVKVARIYSALQTQWNPQFVLTNMARDLETALVNVSDVEDVPAAVRRKILKEALALKSIRGILSALRGNKRSEYAVWFDEYRRAGGKVSFIDTNDVQRIRRRIETSLRAGRIRRGIRGVANLVEDLNTSVENGVRLSVYVHMRKAGISQARAAFVARELTVNFNRKGEWGPALNALYVFFNASAQGTVRMAQALVKSKKARYAVAGIFGVGLALDLINSLMAGDDDDGENAYDKIPEWERERNIIIMIPGDPNHGYIKWPMAYGYNVPFVAGQQLMATLRGIRKPLDAAGTVAATAFDSFNPIGSAPSVAQFLSPTLTDPLVQEAENRTWYGAPIKPQKFNRRLPDSENYFASAPWWAVDLSKTLNSLTGGSPGRSGMIDVSPETFEHYVDFVTGGAGRFVMHGLNTGERVVTGQEWLPEKTPFVRAVFGKATSESRLRDFYDAWDEIDGAHYEVAQLNKAGEREEAADVRQQYVPELRAHGAFKAANKQLGELRKERGAVQQNRKMSEVERERRLNRVRERENAIVLRALKVYSRVKKAEEN